MRTLQGVVKGGAVELPPGVEIMEGTRVIIAILRSPVAEEYAALPPEMEDEDVQFVRACRGRLARELRAQEG